MWWTPRTLLAMPDYSPSSSPLRVRYQDHCHPHSSPPLFALLPIYACIHVLLRSTCNGTFTITGRSTERDVIAKFIASACESDASPVPSKSSLFISGTPGTGKTALVNSVLSGLEYCQDFKVVTVNCMALNNMDNLWDCLCENIESSTLVRRNRGAKAKGKRLLDRILASQDQRWYHIPCHHPAHTDALLTVSSFLTSSIILQSPLMPSPPYVRLLTSTLLLFASLA